MNMGINMKHTLLGAVALLCFSSVSAQAQNLGNIFVDDFFTDATDIASELMDTLIPGVTNVRIGVGPILSSDFEGGDRYEVKAAPLISLRYKDLIQVDNNQIRINFFGESGALWESTNFRAGPMLKIDFGRSESDSLDLVGLGNIGTSFELGGFVSYTMGPLRYRLRVRHDLASGHNGILGDLDVSLAVYRSQAMTVGARLGATWTNARYMNTFFGITPTQAAASGLPVYTATSGFKDVNLSVGSEFRVTPSWAVLGNAGVKRLLSKANSSPLVRQRGSATQFNLGAYAIYSF